MYGYKNIYYDKFTNSITVWDINEEGKTVRKKIKPTIEYYIHDENSNSGLTDIMGIPVKQQVSRSVFAMKKAIELGKFSTCEAFIDQDIKYLQKTYANKNILVDMDHFQVCTIDIEVEIGDDPKPFDQFVEECERPINLITVHYSKDNSTHTWGNKPYTGNYRDIDPNWTYYYVPNEKKMLESFINHFRRRKVDIITGWNCLDENSSVWLKDEIISIKDCTRSYETCYDGKIKDYRHTGVKSGYKITLSDGSSVIASEDHIFPVWSKGKREYRKSTTLINNCEDLSVKDISLDMDRYLKVNLRNNNNNDVCDEFGTIIPNDIFYILGMIYTDGSISKTDNILMIYNKNKSLMSNIINILCKYQLRNKNIDIDSCYKSKRDDTYRVKFSYKNNMLNSIIDYIYDSNMNKRLDINKFSKLSYQQFIAFFSGCVDGDGWVDNKHHSVGFCNYNGDIEKMSELLKWNGVINHLYRSKLRIPCIDVNGKFYTDIKVYHDVKSTLLSDIVLYKPKDSSSKDIKHKYYDGFYLSRIKGIEYIGDINMCDIETENSYFNTNGGIKTHNCKHFDMRYLIDRTEVLDIDLSFSPLNIYEEAFDKISFPGGHDIKLKYYKIAGISQLDGLQLYKNFTFTKEVSYKLGYIGQRVCGEGKVELDDAINKIYETNWNQFVDYNIQDVILVTKIEHEKKFIQLTIELCSQAMIPFENVFSSIKVITGYMLNYLHKYGLVMPDIGRGEKENFPGAYVKADRGVYKHLISYDFASLYPTIIRMFNISPETLVMHPNEEDIPNLIKTPASILYECETPRGQFSASGIYYRKDKQGILPKIVETIYFERVDFKDKAKCAFGIANNYTVEQIAKNQHWSLDKAQRIYDEVMAEGYSEAYYDSQQHIRKILINSMYGVLGNRFFSFYNIKNAMAITIAGRDVIEYVSNNVNKYFKEKWHLTFAKYFPEYSHLKGKLKPIKNDMIPVIDTDSNYICFDEVIKGLGLKFKTNEEFRVWADDFDTRFMKPFFDKILKLYAKKYNAENLHDFKREKIVTSKLVLKKKKYADIVIENEGKVYPVPKLSITGIDMVKTTMPTLFKDSSRDVLKSMLIDFDKDKVVDMLREYKQKFMESDVSDISAPRTVGNYDKWAEDLETYISNGEVYFKPKTPQQNKASMLYNFLIKQKKLMYPFIGNGSQIKVIYVNPNNILQTEIIAYLGDYPKEFEEYFKIDYETQWYKNFIKLIEDFYDAFGWGDVILEKTNIEEFIVF